MVFVNLAADTDVVVWRTESGCVTARKALDGSYSVERKGQVLDEADQANCAPTHLSHVKASVEAPNVVMVGSGCVWHVSYGLDLVFCESWIAKELVVESSTTGSWHEQLREPNIVNLARICALIVAFLRTSSNQTHSNPPTVALLVREKLARV